MNCPRCQKPAIDFGGFKFLCTECSFAFVSFEKPKYEWVTIHTELCGCDWCHPEKTREIE